MQTVLKLKTYPGPMSPTGEPTGDYPCTLFNERWDDGTSYINVKFNPDPENPNQSTFDTVIRPLNFEQIAQIMLDTDAPATIRAFGSALKDYAVDQPTVEAEG